MTTIGEELLTALKKAGAKAVFGLPGDYALPFFDVIENTKILPLYTLSHEPAVGFAADGAARQGGGPGVAVVTYGAGAMNMVNPVACAWAEHSPLVVISGAPGAREAKSGLMLHHQIKTDRTQMNVFAEFTCDQARLDDPAQARTVIARVLNNCLEQSRPVYIELPRDMAQAECALPDGADGTAMPACPQNMQKACLDDLSDRLKNAQSPALLAGARVRRFGLEEAVYDLACKWQVPLLNSFMGKGLFAGKDWPYAGSYLGLAGCDARRRLIEESDLLIMLGVIPCDTNWGVSGRRIDEKKAVLVTETSTTVCGRDYPGVTLRHLVPLLKGIPFDKEHAQRVFLPQPAPHVFTPGANIKADDLAPLIARGLAAAPRKHPLVCDIGDCLFMAMALEGLPVLASGYYATMGFGVPAGLGLCAATGQRPVILTGDGGFQMTGWEIINCQRYGWDPVIIVLNNASWEMLRSFGSDARYSGIASASYAQLANDLGGAGVTVTTPQAFGQAFEHALETRGKFQLIEVILDKGDCTSTMKRFSQTLKDNASKAA